MAQFTTLIISALGDMRDSFPQMTFGEILYTLLRKNYIPTKPDGVNTSWLLNIKDEDFYNAIEKVIKNEVETEE